MLRFRALGFSFAALAALCLSGCNGPASTCEGTLNSYASCVNKQDWECFVPLIWAPHVKKAGAKQIKEVFQDNFFGYKNFRWTVMQPVETKDLCLARTTSSWTYKIRGKNPEDHNDEFDSFTLHRVDGLWYMEMRGMSKISAF